MQNASGNERITMVVPSYWGRPRGEASRPGDLVFDHPTPLDGEETLARLLDSLSILNPADFDLVLIAAPVSAELGERAEQRTREIVAAHHPGVPVSLLAPSTMARCAAAIGPGATAFADLLSLNGYPHVRNACLLAAMARGADIALLIDDDELFHLPDFIARVRTGLAAAHESGPVRILAGYYVSATGEYLLRRPLPAWGTEWPKYQVMDEAFTAVISAPPRFKRTPFAFGGNLAVRAEIFRELPFDTSITRGEDLDYLMMAALHGTATILDNTLSIRHLAPPKSHPDWQQFRQDALRFARQRAKLLSAAARPELRPLAAEDLDPYPGLFLRENLEERVDATAIALANDYREKGDGDGERESLRTVELFRSASHPETDPLVGFEDQHSRWRELAKLMQGSVAAALLQEIAHA